MVVWICGPSAAGKTTIGRNLYDHLKPSVGNLVLIDGDDFRRAMGDDLGYSTEDRRLNSVRIARFCHLLDAQDIHVICCAVTIHPEAQALSRKVLKNYHEVLISVSMDTLLRRDRKDIYRKALNGELADVVGVQIPYVPPVNPDLVIENDSDCSSFEPIVERLVRHFVDHGSLPECIPDVRRKT